MYVCQLPEAGDEDLVSVRLAGWLVGDVWFPVIDCHAKAVACHIFLGWCLVLYAGLARHNAKELLQQEFSPNARRPFSSPHFLWHVTTHKCG